MTSLVFKLVDRPSWDAVPEAGSFGGSPVDLRDGFIHFSTASQVQETARRYFAGQSDLLLVAVDTAALGDALRWEPSRCGELFPHLYAPLPRSAVRWIRDLPLDDSRLHVFPEL